MTPRVSLDPSRNVDHAYDQFLLSREKRGLDALKRFEEKLHHSSLKFGRFTIPTFFKPHFITSKQERLLHSVFETLIRMTDRLTSLYFSDPVIKSAFGISSEVEELIRIDPGYSRTAVLVRLDCLLEGERLKLVEFNADAPGGVGYADALEQILFEEEELDDFFREFNIERQTRCQKLLDTLLNVYEEFGGFETPRIAIVDWRTVRTRAELELLKLFFEEKGYKATIADPRELKYRGGKLYHGNFKIDLIYRRVVVPELVEKLDEVSDFIKAYKDRAVCVVNPFRSRLAASKLVFSIYTNPAYDHLFSEKENELKREHIPWTRFVSDAERFYGGKKIYLVDFLKDEKESLVLKPAEGFGGKDVTIGRETRDNEWNLVIDKALKSNWVIQEVLDAPMMTVPAVVNDKLEFVAKRMNTCCFVFDGTHAGGFSRLSEESVINVSRSGGMIPTVLCEAEINR